MPCLPGQRTDGRPKTIGRRCREVRSYEMLVILDATTENQSEEISKIEELLKNLGGTVSKTDAWGKKTLAYPIRKQTEGY